MFIDLVKVAYSLWIEKIVEKGANLKLVWSGKISNQSGDGGLDKVLNLPPSRRSRENSGGLKSPVKESSLMNFHSACQRRRSGTHLSVFSIVSLSTTSTPVWG